MLAVIPTPLEMKNETVSFLASEPLFLFITSDAISHEPSCAPIAQVALSLYKIR